HFRRPKLLTESGAISEIVKSNLSDRMRSYLEAGCTHHNETIQNMNKLHSCQEKLNDHISKAKLLLEELHILEEDVYSTTLKACLSSLRHMDDCPDDNSLTNIFSEDEQQSGDLLDKAVSCASVMVLVHNMLKLDYTMQEKIVKALCIKTASSELEGYCQMWDLRPYIDDNVIQLAWQFVS
ncbi:Os07g0264900, partial [Oryza sativa Japonica Group]